MLSDDATTIVSVASHAKKRRTAMKIIVSMLIALSLFAGIAAPASAFDGKTFWEQQSRAAY